MADNLNLNPQTDLSSFWEHYDAVKQWIQIANASLDAAYNDCEWRHAEEQLDLRDTTPAKSPSIHEDFICQISTADQQQIEDMEISYEEEEDDLEISPEYLEFIRTTEEHRRKRDEMRKLQNQTKDHLAENGWLGNDVGDFDEYVSASDFGIHGIESKTIKAPEHQREAEERESRMARDYGAHAERLRALEIPIQCTFSEYCGKYEPVTWPNIPLRLK